jgi:cell fate regulator YaaT (PSP1 superfamily)
MAKEQGLPLNPSKISGVCGRLMCCLAYENDNYIQAKQQMPHIGAILDTPSGPGKVVSINVPHNTVEVMLESGATIHVPANTQSGCGSCRDGACSRPKSGGGGCGTGCGSCSFKRKT